MREIKFRGKRPANGEWVYGNLVTWHNKPAIQDYFKTNGEIFLVDPETVGQYTGIKDDNGKEIYEGDIIRIREFEFKSLDWEVYQVKYHGDMDYPAFDTEPSIDCDSNGLSYAKACCEIEVISNIFEKPELLEVAE